jgi:hypothetical protein
MLTIVGSNFGIILWAMRERRADFLYITRLIEEIKNDVRDFHTRLELIDQDFKNKLCAMEEKRKK